MNEKDGVAYYTPSETERLIEMATSDDHGKPCYRMGWIVPLILNMGIRVCELATLKWKKHVDLDKREIIIEDTQIIVKNRDPNAEKKYIIKNQRANQAIGT